MAVELGFNVSTTRFLDRDIARALDPVKRRFFMRSGGAIRTTARRSLRKARQMKLSEMTDSQVAKYRQQMERFKAGLIRTRPRRPEVTADRGDPPKLHQKPTSLLKDRLFFSLDDDRNGVVIGPEQTSRSGDLQRLEDRFPFMEPAYETIEPRLPAYLSAAAN